MGSMGGFSGGGRQGGQIQSRNTGTAAVMRDLWFINGDGKLEAMQVEAGISNGTFTEIRADEDLENRQFILREKI
jgi:hypothetical protein